MPSSYTPPSLEELIALKRKGKEGGPNPKVNKPSKTRFLTKRQREKLEEQTLLDRQVTAKPTTKTETALLNLVVENNIQEDTESPLLKPDETVRSRSKTNKFKFEWDESDDTSLDAYSVSLPTEKYDYSLDLPYRKKQNKNAFYDVHWSQKPLESMTDRDWRIVKEDFNISIRGNTKQKILRSWRDGAIPDNIIKQLEKLQYKDPTPIQRAAIPLGLAGNDIIGMAETGSGKTLAYLIPSLSYVMNLPPVRPFESPYVLIIVPTRELAQQIESQYEKFMNNIPFKVASIIGGQSYQKNVEKLEQGVEILVGTPGRLLDILEKKIVDLDRCFFLIADEADRTIDMGFQAQFQAILEQLPRGETNPFHNGKGTPKRTTLMFTATMNKNIEGLIHQYLIDPISISVGEINRGVDSVVQDAIQVSNNDDSKMATLRKILGSSKYPPPIIIFVNYRKYCDTLCEFLKQLNYRPVAIHGSISQELREDAIRKIKEKEADILVATDVAGRGIDIPNVSLVINYHMSSNISEYIHRIGRTGRAGQKGASITFWNTETDAETLPELRNIIMQSEISKCPQDLRYHEVAQAKGFKNIDT